MATIEEQANEWIRPIADADDAYLIRRLQEVAPLITEDPNHALFRATIARKLASLLAARTTKTKGA